MGRLGHRRGLLGPRPLGPRHLARHPASGGVTRPGPQGLHARCSLAVALAQVDGLCRPRGGRGVDRAPRSSRRPLVARRCGAPDRAPSAVGVVAVAGGPARLCERGPAEVLIAAGAALGDALRRDGLLLLTWLLAIETSGDHLSVTPVGGRGQADAGQLFDQQLIEGGSFSPTPVQPRLHRHGRRRLVRRRRAGALLVPRRQRRRHVTARSRQWWRVRRARAAGPQREPGRRVHAGVAVAILQQGRRVLVPSG